MQSSTDFASKCLRERNHISFLKKKKKNYWSRLKTSQLGEWAGGGGGREICLIECAFALIYSLTPIRGVGLFVLALGHQHVSRCAQHYSEHATFDTVMLSARDTQVCRHSTWCGRLCVPSVSASDRVCLGGKLL